MDTCRHSFSFAVYRCMRPQTDVDVGLASIALFRQVRLSRWARGLSAHVSAQRIAHMRHELRGGKRLY
jgi:hypothetical protein